MKLPDLSLQLTLDYDLADALERLSADALTAANALRARDTETDDGAVQAEPQTAASGAAPSSPRCDDQMRGTLVTHTCGLERGHEGEHACGVTIGGYGCKHRWA